MKKGGRGTGTERSKRFAAMFAGWPTCDHKCPAHGVWTHRAVPGAVCHFPMFVECAACFEYPTPYGCQLAVMH